MAARKIAVIVGSLRKESFNRKLCKTLMLLAPPTLEMEFVEIGPGSSPVASWKPSWKRFATFASIPIRPRTCILLRLSRVVLRVGSSWPPKPETS